MYAVVGRFKLEHGREDEARERVTNRGVAMLQGMDGSAGGWWYRTTEAGDVVQHSLWLFDTEDHARAAEETFEVLHALPTAPTVSVGVYEVLAEA
jgi:hypothetical protein